MPHIRVLQLITRADWGGAQRHLFDLVTRLDPKRFHVSVACAPDGPLVDKLGGAGITVIPVKDFQREVNPFRDLRAIQEVREIIRFVKADIVHCHSSKAGILGRFAAKQLGVPVVYTAHGFSFAGHAASLPVRALYLAAEWLAGRAATDLIITVSEADRRLALTYRLTSPERVVTVHNGIDPSVYSSIPDPVITGRPPVIGVVTRLVRGKGIEDLLSAAAILLEQGQFRFVVAGEGPMRQAFEKKDRRLGIAEHVTFPGFVPPESILPAIDLFVFPSYKEGLPYSILEALAAGRPVVATSVGGIPEIIRHGQNGWLVRPGRVEDLAETIKEALSTPSFADVSAAARHTIWSQFQVSAMVEHTARLYETVMQSESP